MSDIYFLYETLVWQEPKPNTSYSIAIRQPPWTIICLHFQIRHLKTAIGVHHQVIKSNTFNHAYIYNDFNKSTHSYWVFLHKPLILFKKWIENNLKSFRKKNGKLNKGPNPTLSLPWTRFNSWAENWPSCWGVNTKWRPRTQINRKDCVRKPDRHKTCANLCAKYVDWMI